MLKKILIANRGEIAVRIARALHDLGCASVAVFAQDDAGALHTQLADHAVALQATGPAAYLDGAALIVAARAPTRQGGLLRRACGQNTKLGALVLPAGLLYFQ